MPLGRAAGPTETAATLKADPGAGLATPRDTSRAAGRQARNQTAQTGEARDRSGPPLHQCAFSDMRDSTPSTRHHDRDIDTSAAAVATRQRLAKRALVPFQILSTLPPAKDESAQPEEQRHDSAQLEAALILLRGGICSGDV